MSIPEHVAIIMDGNGRWSKERGLPRSAGHEAGARTLSRLIEDIHEFPIKWLTLFAFSSENWARPTEEIEDLFLLLRKFVENDLEKIKQNNIRIRIIGDRHSLPEDILDLLTQSEKLTQENDGLTVVIAFNYGSRNEILRAVKKICNEVQSGIINIKDISVENIAEKLDTNFMPDPDLIIRTSGEMRLSNFLLWQSAYSELFFISSFWPDFTKNDLQKALDSYASRERRFGAISL